MTKTTTKPATASVVSSDSNNSAWSILYAALINGIGQSPKTFQLIYPMTSWNWPTNNPGFTSAEQYDFCSLIPQWSAVGSYVSSGNSFDTSYGQFLNYILQTTTNPTLQQQILTAQNNLTQASANLQTTAAQAQSTYNSTVTNNNPTYTAWLGTPAGLGYASQIAAQTTLLEQAQAVVNQLAQEQTTPNIADALAAFATTTTNPNPYYTKLVDPGLSGFPLVPNYSISETSAAWVQQVQGGGGTGGTISFTNTQSGFDYSKTWAEGSMEVGGLFWQVYANGQWQQISQFYTDSSLSVTIKFAAWDQISITPSKWYSGTTLFRNGPFMPGYTAYEQSGSTAYMFGEGGLIPLLKTNMVVCYQPTITISCSQETYESFLSEWSVAGGIQIGPFQLGGGGGDCDMSWNKTGSQMSLTVTSTSTVPLILGVNVAVEPS